IECDGALVIGGAFVPVCHHGHHGIAEILTHVFHVPPDRESIAECAGVSESETHGRWRKRAEVEKALLVVRSNRFLDLAVVGMDEGKREDTATTSHGSEGKTREIG